MSVVRIHFEPISFWRRLTDGRRTLRGCTMPEGAHRYVDVHGHSDYVSLYDSGISSQAIAIPDGYRLVIEVSKR